MGGMSAPLCGLERVLWRSERTTGEGAEKSKRIGTYSGAGASIHAPVKNEFTPGTGVSPSAMSLDVLSIACDYHEANTAQI